MWLSDLNLPVIYGTSTMKQWRDSAEFYISNSISVACSPTFAMFRNYFNKSGSKWQPNKLAVICRGIGEIALTLIEDTLTPSGHTLNI